jgi:SAM-dependent methyltransferase
VTAVDIDAWRLSELGQAAASLSGGGSIARVLADGTCPLPFRDGAFDLVLVVDFVAPGFIAELARVLRHDGCLVIQTYGGQGQNWMALPEPGQFRRELEDAFDVLDYRETPVGPTKREAASVRFLARRVATPARDRTT